MKHPLPNEAACFGCMACYNVCPVNAIEMAESARGFIIPEVHASCLDCGKCASVCPSLHPLFDNEAKPDMYSVQADDDVRKHSTSGGMFTLMAQEIIDRGGSVCGAVFDEDLKLHHVLTKEWSSVLKMRGSKYIQSNIEHCFSEIKAALERGEWVLFTGTPCQAAGLKTFLARTYERLVIVDLLCHGTPSQKAYDSYIAEISDGRKAVNTEFRSKRFGWTWSHILTTFSDGSEHVGDKSDPYKQAFSKRLLWRDTCPDCQFATFPRQGDITIGDLWGSKTLDPDSMDKKGTSHVFLNNERGRAFFEAVRKRATYCKKLEVDDYDAIPNRVNNKDCKSHPHRERFLEMLGDYPFSKAVSDALHNHYDIAMPTGLYNLNLGGVLTYFMLFHALKDLGYSVMNLAAPETASRRPWKPAIEFCQEHLPSYAQPKRYANVMQMRELNKRCGMFVLGSDQYLTESMCREFADVFLLNFAESNKPLVAVSASFGNIGSRRSKQFVDEMAYYLNRFTAISCREDSGVDYANNILKLDRKASWVIDPIFIADSHYLTDMVKEDAGQEPFVGAYIITPSESKWELVDRVHEAYPGSALRVMGRADAREIKKEVYLKKKGVVPEPTFPVEDSLSLISNCKFFVTDSFHGMCLAVIMKKEFVALPRSFPDRFDSVLGRLGLADRILTNDLSEFDLTALHPIDWGAVDSKLEVLRNDALSFMRRSLSFEDTKPLSDYDLAMREVVALQKQIDELNKRVVKTEKKWDKLRQTLPYKVYKRLKRR